MKFQLLLPLSEKGGANGPTETRQTLLSRAKDGFSLVAVKRLGERGNATLRGLAAGRNIFSLFATAVAGIKLPPGFPDLMRKNFDKHSMKTPH